jgi:hypothetical protein
MLDESLSERRYFIFPMLPFSLPEFEIQQISCTEVLVTITARATA